MLRFMLSLDIQYTSFIKAFNDIGIKAAHAVVFRGNVLNYFRHVFRISQKPKLQA